MVILTVCIGIEWLSNGCGIGFMSVTHLACNDSGHSYLPSTVMWHWAILCSWESNQLMMGLVMAVCGWFKTLTCGAGLLHREHPLQPHQWILPTGLSLHFT